MIGELLSKNKDYCFLFINMEKDRFKTSFSKWEMVSGLEVVFRVIDEFKIDLFSVSTDCESLSDVKLTQAQNNGPGDIPFKSAYDDKFLEQFDSFVKKIPKSITVKFHDVFFFQNVTAPLVKSNLSKILICGFDAEREILASVIGAVREGFIPIVLSDCISSRSERVFFEVLNVMSRWAVIGDTRDMVKLWNLW